MIVSWRLTFPPQGPHLTALHGNFAKYFGCGVTLALREVRHHVLDRLRSPPWHVCLHLPDKRAEHRTVCGLCLICVPYACDRDVCQNATSPVLRAAAHRKTRIANVQRSVSSSKPTTLKAKSGNVAVSVSIGNVSPCVSSIMSVLSLTLSASGFPS
jgi:hypothetical protein